MSENLNKRPAKGILKTSHSMDSADGTGAPSTSKRSKEQRFDEMNVLATLHPPGKDYGHMKIDEPPTPYAEMEDSTLNAHDEVDANILAAKLAASMNKPPRCTVSSDDSDDEFQEETEDERKKRFEFEKKRKLHYNEFQAMQLAKQLLEEEDDEEDTPISNQMEVTKVTEEAGCSQGSTGLGEKSKP